MTVKTDSTWLWLGLAVLFLVGRRRRESSTVIQRQPTPAGLPAMLDFGRPADVRLVVSSGWARPRRGPPAHVHHALDIPIPTGTPLRAVAPGTVKTAQQSDAGAAGRYVAIDHGSLVTRYLHMSRVDVDVGDQVDAGDLIGQSGDTGNSDRPHLHFDLHVHPANLATVVLLIGVPKGGYPPAVPGLGVPVPAEPFLPVDDYNTRTRTDALDFGIPLRTTN